MYGCECSIYDFKAPLIN